MDQGQLVMRLVAAEGAVISLRRALRRLVAAENQFHKDTGIKLDDLISEAVKSAEYVLEATQQAGNDSTSAAVVPSNKE